MCPDLPVGCEIYDCYVDNGDHRFKSVVDLALSIEELVPRYVFLADARNRFIAKSVMLYINNVRKQNMYVLLNKCKADI